MYVKTLVKCTPRLDPLPNKLPKRPFFFFRHFKSKMDCYAGTIFRVQTFPITVKTKSENESLYMYTYFCVCRVSLQKRLPGNPNEKLENFHIPMYINCMLLRTRPVVIVVTFQVRNVRISRVRMTNIVRWWAQVVVGWWTVNVVAVHLKQRKEKT